MKKNDGQGDEIVIKLFKEDLRIEVEIVSVCGDMEGWGSTEDFVVWETFPESYQDYLSVRGNKAYITKNAQIELPSSLLDQHFYITATRTYTKDGFRDGILTTN